MRNLPASEIGWSPKGRVDTFKDQAFDGVIEQINTRGEFTTRHAAMSVTIRSSASK
ncbi:MAG TPA: hypothetical protein VFD58_13870 [Blastocatellia bacterium]|nr:hypothetical protein [Blastocatellia bacterium]